jgi:hypothetical protein
MPERVSPDNSDPLLRKEARRAKIKRPSLGEKIEMAEVLLERVAPFPALRLQVDGMTLSDAEVLIDQALKAVPAVPLPMLGELGYRPLPELPYMQTVQDITMPDGTPPADTSPESGVVTIRTNHMSSSSKRDR